MLPLPLRLPHRPLLPLLPLLPDEPDEPEEPLLPEIPLVPEVPEVPPVPDEPTAAATFLYANLLVTGSQITTSFDEPEGKLWNAILLLNATLPLTPKLPLIVSDAFIVWSLLMFKNDDVSVFAEFNAYDAVNEVIA